MPLLERVSLSKIAGGKVVGGKLVGSKLAGGKLAGKLVLVVVVVCGSEVEIVTRSSMVFDPSTAKINNNKTR